MPNIIGYQVWVQQGDDVQIYNFESGDFEAEAEQFAGAFDDALMIPVVDVLVIGAS